MFSDAGTPAASYMGLPQVLRTGTGPELLHDMLTSWARDAGMAIQYIQPVKPNQNAYVDASTGRTVMDLSINTCLPRWMMCGKPPTEGRVSTTRNDHTLRWAANTV